MLVKVFTVADPKAHEEEFSKWWNDNPGIRVLSKHICAHNAPAGLDPRTFSAFDRVYVYYETGADVQYSRDRDLISENAQIEMCKDIAKAIFLNKEDYATYRKIRNADQRSIYFLENHNIPEKDADKVHQLLTMYHDGTLPAPEPYKKE
jgi:hypothetical protein